MSKLFSKINKLSNFISGRGYLAIAIFIFAASSSIIRKLTDIGGENLIDGRNPISFCNVLFVGNLCALLTLLSIYGKQWTKKNLQQLSTSDWFGLIGVAILSGALAPALTFAALERTSVNNVVLIGRIEPPLSLALAIVILKDKVNFWVILGAIISFIGVVLTIILQTPDKATMMEVGGGFMIGFPELMALGGAIALSCSGIISRVKLNQIPLGIFAVFRTTIGTIVFFIVTVYMFGLGHFTDVFSPFIWKWMLLYGTIIVVGGRISWFQGLKRSNASDISLASSFSPLIGILMAYFLLGETPTKAQYIGGFVIIIGIVLTQVGVFKKLSKSKNKSLKKDVEVGFKGV